MLVSNNKRKKIVTSYNYMCLLHVCMMLVFLTYVNMFADGCFFHGNPLYYNSIFTPKLWQLYIYIYIYIHKLYINIYVYCRGLCRNKCLHYLNIPHICYATFNSNYRRDLLKVFAAFRQMPRIAVVWKGPLTSLLRSKDRVRCAHTGYLNLCL